LSRGVGELSHGGNVVILVASMTKGKLRGRSKKQTRKKKREYLGGEMGQKARGRNLNEGG